MDCGVARVDSWASVNVDTILEQRFTKDAGRSENSVGGGGINFMKSI